MHRYIHRISTGIIMVLAFLLATTSVQAAEPLYLEQELSKDLSDIAADGNYLYGIRNLVSGNQALQVRTNLQPGVTHGSVEIGGKNGVITEAQDGFVVVQFVNSDGTSRMRIFDVRDPQNPIAGFEFNPLQIQISGTKAVYKIAGSNKIYVADISDPYNFVVLGNWGGAGSPITSSYDIEYVGDYLFLLDRYTPKLTAIDISDPDNLVAMWDKIWTNSWISSPKATKIEYRDDKIYVYVEIPSSGGTSHSYQVFDVSNPVAQNFVQAYGPQTNTKGDPIHGFAVNDDAVYLTYTDVDNFGPYTYWLASDSNVYQDTKFEFPSSTAGFKLAATEDKLFVLTTDALQIYQHSTPTYDLNGIVLDANTRPVEGATVRLLNNLDEEATTDQIGSFAFTELEAGVNEIYTYLLFPGFLFPDSSVSVTVPGQLPAITTSWAIDRFRPNKNGYSFVNRGVDGTEEFFAEIYGLEPDNIGIVEERWLSNKIESAKGGLCFGMAMTAALDVDDNLIENPFQTDLFSLSEPQTTYNDGIQKYDISDDTTEYIAKFDELHSFKDYQSNYHSSVKSQSLFDAFTLIKNGIDSDQTHTIMITLNGRVNESNEECGVHAVYPYAYQNMGDGTYQIAVYDPNKPYLVSSPEYTKQIISINPSQEYWHYSFAESVGINWGSNFTCNTIDQESGEFMYENESFFVATDFSVLIENGKTVQLTPDYEDSDLIANSGMVRLEDENGNILGEENNKFVDEIEDAWEYRPISAIPGQDGDGFVSYKMESLYPIEIVHFSQPVDIELFSPDYYLHLSSNAVSGSSEFMELDPDADTITLTAEADITDQSLQVIGQYGDDERQYQLLGLVGSDGSKTVLDMSDDGTSTTFTSTIDQPVTMLVLGEHTADGWQEFSINLPKMSAGTTFILQPTWNETGNLTLGIDNNSDGHPDRQIEITQDDPQVIYFSLSSAGKAKNNAFKDEDVVAYNQATGQLSLIIDGQDVGLGTTDINAVDVLSDGTLLLSLNKWADLPGLGRVDDNDIIRFIPQTLGDDTSGSFEMYLDGDSAGLNDKGENINGISQQEDGSILISTLGRNHVTGSDADVLRWDPENQTWSVYISGSGQGFTSDNGQDIWGVESIGESLLLSTKKALQVGAQMSTSMDIVHCQATDDCQFTLWWRNALPELEDKRLDGISVGYLITTQGMEVMSSQAEVQEPEDASDDIVQE